MNWWDQGYWIMQRARRVPVSNPTQERAPNAARFYAETDEAEPGVAAGERARFVLSDWELPFRPDAERPSWGAFKASSTGPGRRTRSTTRSTTGTESGWTPVWVFHEPYYRSMAYRLAVLGGAAATPVERHDAS